jgi:hypothetical protein
VKTTSLVFSNFSRICDISARHLWWTIQQVFADRAL